MYILPNHKNSYLNKNDFNTNAAKIYFEMKYRNDTIRELNKN